MYKKYPYMDIIIFIIVNKRLCTKICTFITFMTLAIFSHININ